MLTEKHSDKISIIVPVYKVEPYLRRCIKSLLAQTHENVEIILVDDGSPDNCGQICDGFAEEDSRIIVIHKENGGLCSARNAALQVATGDYIGFVDSDDWIAEDMYEYLLSGLRLHDADIACCKYFRVTPEGRHVFTNKENNQPTIFDADAAIKDVVTKWNIRTLFCNKLFKRELFKGFIFPEGVVYESTLTMHRLLTSIEKLVMLPEPKYYYLIRSDSVVNTATVSNQIDCVLAHISRYSDLCISHPQLKSELMQHIVHASTELVRSCYARKNEINNNMDRLGRVNINPIPADI